MISETIYQRLHDIVGPLVGLVSTGGFSDGFSNGFDVYHETTKPRIFPVWTQNQLLPLVIYQVDDQTPEKACDGNAGLTTYTVKIDSIAVNETTARTVSQAVIDALDDWTEGVVRISELDGGEQTGVETPSGMAYQFSNNFNIVAEI